MLWLILASLSSLIPSNMNQFYSISKQPAALSQTPEDFYILANWNIDMASLSRYLSHQSQKLAVDTAYFIQAEPPQHLYGSIVWKMMMPDTFNFKFNLVQLATLLLTVSCADQEYNIKQKNCYWFTGMVCKLVVQIVNDATAEVHQEISPSNIIDHGRYLQLWHAGHYLSFFRLDGYSPNLAQIVYAKYRDEYLEFWKNVGGDFSCLNVTH
jgi:hypothetical protein